MAKECSCKHDGTSGGLVGGNKSHAQGGVKAIVDGKRPVEIESGEVIINKESAKRFHAELSRINQAGGGVPIKKPIEQKVFKEGGVIGKRNLMYIGESGGSKLKVTNNPGWFENPFDKKNRFEISDENAALKNDEIDKIKNELKLNPEKTLSFSVSKFFEHKTFFEAYPEFKNIKIIFSYAKDKSQFAVTKFYPGKNNPNEAFPGIFYNFFEEDRRARVHGRGGAGLHYCYELRTKVLLHELQHIGQIREGFATGSTIMQEYRRIAESKTGHKLSAIPEGLQNFYMAEAEEFYKNSAGEIEANETVKRRKLTDAQRKKIPYLAGYNYDESKVTSRFHELPKINWDKVGAGDNEFKHGGNIYFKEPHHTDNLNFEINARAYDGTKIKINTSTKLQQKHLKEYLKPIRENNQVKYKLEESQNVQTILFDKSKFSPVEAKAWLKKEGYKTGLDEGVTVYRFRQQDPYKFNQKSFKGKKIAKGITMVMGKLLEK